MKLSAQILGREALMILRNLRADPLSHKKHILESYDFDFGEQLATRYPNQFYSTTYLPPDALNLSLEDVSEKYVIPAVERLHLITWNKVLTHDYMELPMGADDAANDRLSLVALRTVIAKRLVPSETTIRSEYVEKFYRIATDEVLPANVVTALRFDVRAVILQDG